MKNHSMIEPWLGHGVSQENFQMPESGEEVFSHIDAATGMVMV